MYAAPQTPDGWVTRAEATDDGRFAIELAFPAAKDFTALVDGRHAEVVFAARSRLARLGINTVPTSSLVLDDGYLRLTATIQATVRAYGVADLLPHIVQPGLRLGRLVFCPAERRLTSEQIDELVRAHAVQLPRSYSVDHEGRFRIRPHACVYDLSQPLTVDLLRTITAREDGKDVLNRLQMRRDVKRIALEPDDGVITSCSMFLHRHYVVLESEGTPLGQHLEAVVLDPVTTRGMDVFLEFFNRTEHRIVNPNVAASMYDAAQVDVRPTMWFGADLEPPPIPAEAPDAEHAYRPLAALFDRLEGTSQEERYSHRLVAVVDDIPAALDGQDPIMLWRHPEPEVSRAPAADLASRLSEGVIDDPKDVPFGTEMLTDLAPGAQVTLLLGYFPNLVEHTHICAAALEHKIDKIIFRRASYEHGSFFSARDHGRLADYQSLGIDVWWCNDARRHVVTHVFRGLRGFFTEPRNVERFRSSLVFAAYGSAKPLPKDQVRRIERLLVNLRTFFGEDIAIMTGGGPGAMQQATDTAQSLGMLVGASFIETVDQETNQTAEFYQTFQGRSRHSRQRWFEIASFHLFFMGGVGTLEEVGLTLTDMKLGVIEVSPMVFFGRHRGRRYWRQMREQFKVMVAADRAPQWLRTHVLMTDDPDEVPRFYQSRLQLG